MCGRYDPNKTGDEVSEMNNEKRYTGTRRYNWKKLVLGARFCRDAGNLAAAQEFYRNALVQAEAEGTSLTDVASFCASVLWS
jgi:hypothetical protein